MVLDAGEFKIAAIHLMRTSQHYNVVENITWYVRGFFVIVTLI
jgi:hypothetical protein